jgi:CheY-like chemotaxis protein
MTDPAQDASILIVDDEPEVAALLAEILADDDYRVETAYNGLAALDKLRDGTYDLIISDLRMPISTAPGSTARSRGAIRRWSAA